MNYGRNLMGDLHDLYLETDVMLLADVFETFRRTIKKQYNFDPVHFITAPGLSWINGWHA